MAEHYINSDNSNGYSIRNKQGNISTRKFINDSDYSLDLIKLREIYEKAYRRTNFGFFENGKEYTQHIINVTFKYSLKEYNQIRKGLFVKNGYNLFEFVNDIRDCVYVKDGELIAIQTNEDIISPLSQEQLGKYFWFEEEEIKRGKRKGEKRLIYRAKQNIKSIMSSKQLRDDIYINGFNCDGIHYVRFKRSSGASRVGKCLFINERLHSRIHKWDLCGLDIKEGDKTDLAALEPYFALPSSSIIDTLEIFPENILLIDDYTSVFEEDMIAVTEDAEGWLVAEHKTTKVSNNIWDGQSLLDESIFEEAGYYNKGCMLLRNRFFKSCCFSTGIQRFFEDNNIKSVSQLKGKTLAKNIKDIKLITTHSSIKYLKFGTFENWLKNIDYDFGIVKTEKETYYFNGRMVQAHYQLLNTVQMTYEKTNNFLSPSLNYLHLLKTDPAVVRYHIKYPENKDYKMPLTALESKNDIVYKLLDINENFSKTKLYADFRNDLTRSFASNLKCGHVLINGNYETLFGNPLEMLKASVNMFDETSCILPGHVHTLNFPWGTELLGSRSPHVAIGNILLTKNISCPEIDLYFNLTNEIVCINSIKENILERFSGADFDSDTALFTDNEILIEAARKNYDTFKVPTNLVRSTKSQYSYTKKDLSDLDCKTGDNYIGEVINLSQELNTLIWHRLNNGASYQDIEDIYLDVAKLDVLSNIEIDKAKKQRNIETKREIKKIKQKYGITDKTGKPIKPKFFSHISKMKGFYVPGKKKYLLHDSVMDYVYDIVVNADKKERAIKNYPFSIILNKNKYSVDRVNHETIERIIELLRQYRVKHKTIWSNTEIEKDTKYELSNECRQEFINYINSIRIGYSTMVYLLMKMEDEEHKDISSVFLQILFGIPNKSFFNTILESVDKIPILYEVLGNRYDVKLYDYKFAKDYIRNT